MSNHRIILFNKNGEKIERVIPYDVVETINRWILCLGNKCVSIDKYMPSEYFDIKDIYDIIHPYNN